MAIPLSIEDLDYLAPDERAEIEALLEDRFGGQEFRPFLKKNFPKQKPPAHMGMLVDAIEQARHERSWVLVSTPPRHTKTTHILRGLVWWLSRDSADTCGYFSYNDQQARSKSRLARDWARQVGVELRGDSKNLSEWRTEQGGGFLAGGVGGALTGQGISGLMVVDDPIKNRLEANSELVRDRIYEWFNEVVFTRLEGASVFVVATRWHEDDLIGRLEREHGDKWRTINLQAIAEPGDVLGRKEGEPLWPEKFPRQELDEILRQIGEWSFASLYQGRPRPRGGRLFGQPAVYGKYPTFNESRIFIACDPAATAKTRADYSAIVVGAARLEYTKTDMGTRIFNTHVDILEVERVQVEIPELVRKLVDMQKKWQAPICIEAVGGFKAVPQMIRRITNNVIIHQLHPQGDKFTRALPVAAAWNSGRIRLPIEAPWLEDFVREVGSFTGVNDAHDDQVDALAHLYTYADAMLRNKVKRGIKAEHLPFG